MTDQDEPPQAVQVRIVIPDKTTPGFARRLHKVAQFQESIASRGFGAKLIEEMIDFFADFAEGDKEQAKEYLWDCSEEQFMELLTGVSGGDASQVDPQKS